MLSLHPLPSLWVLFLELLGELILSFPENTKQIIKMTVLDLLRVCRGVSIGMHAQRKASVGWIGPIDVIYSNLVLKADYHHQYIWSSVNLSCLVMKTPRNGNTASFLHWCPCEELFSEIEPLKGEVFFSVTFYYGAPPAITKMNLTLVITVIHSKGCCC